MEDDILDECIAKISKKQKEGFRKLFSRRKENESLSKYRG